MFSSIYSLARRIIICSETDNFKKSDHLSAGAVEETDCTSKDRYHSLPPMSVLRLTLNHHI